MDVTMNDYQFYRELFSIRNLNIKDVWKNQITNEQTKLKESDLYNFIQTIKLNEQDLSKREIIRVIFQEILRNNSYDCELFDFGSTKTGLGTYDSDIDFHIRLFTTNGMNGQKSINQLSNENARGILLLLKKLFRDKLRNLFMVLYIDAKCPIIKLKPRTNMGKNKAGGTPMNNNNISNSRMIECDINVTNPFGIYNSIFLNYLCEYCPQFQSLTILLRLWAKLNNLICYDGMNSYTFTMLVLYFFQSEKLIAPIEQMNIDFCDHFFRTDPEDFKQLIGDKCKSLISIEHCNPSIFELLWKFFHFYSQFDLYNHVISVRLGRSVRKNEFIEQIVGGKYEFPMYGMLSIEDPFELARNLSNRVSFVKIVEFVRLCEKYQLKSRNNFNDVKTFQKFLLNIESKSNDQKIHPIIPCKCIIIKHLGITNVDGNLFINFIAYHCQLILKIFGDLYEKKIPIKKKIQSFNLLEIDQLITIDRFKETLTLNIDMNMRKKSIKICKLLIESSVQDKLKIRRSLKNKITKELKNHHQQVPNNPGPSNSSSINTVGKNDKNKNNPSNNNNEGDGLAKKIKSGSNADHNNTKQSDSIKVMFDSKLIFRHESKYFGYFDLFVDKHNLSYLRSFIQNRLCICSKK